MTLRAAIAYLASVAAFITVMAGFRIPDWSIVAECAVAAAEVPFVQLAVVAIGVVGIAEWRAGKRAR